MGVPVLFGVFRLQLGRSSNRLFQVMSPLSPLPSSMQTQARTITQASLLELPDNYPEPWPYKEEGYNHMHAFYEGTTKRFHTNSKLIVLEGNVGSGKSKLGEELADVLGFHFMPEFKMDDILIDRYGIDRRDYYHMFPKRFRFPDANIFFKAPFDDQTAVMQDIFYRCRFEQYCNALAHILNTGQGVILERSVYSDFVFTNAMRAKNYIGQEYFKYYYYLRKMTLPTTRLYPHLVIYLDCPVSKCLESIKKRGNENEIRIVDEKYLTIMADSYKDMLRELKRHSRILVYDWTEPANLDSIVEDIEGLEFDFFHWMQGDVLETWHSVSAFGGDGHWNFFRARMTDKSFHFGCFENIRKHEVGELFIHPHDAFQFEKVMRNEVLKSPYGYGYTNRDPMQGMALFRPTSNLPEKWFEYGWKEAYLDNLGGNYRFFELPSYYNPDSVHHH